MPASAQSLVVFSAASLKTAIDEIAMQFEQETGTAVVVSYAGSAALARQIVHGAPADIFISANPDWMDWLEVSDHIRAKSRFDLVSNRMVVIASGPDAVELDLQSSDAVTSRLSGERIAMALVAAVPAGLYGKAALQNLGIWDSLEPQVVQSDNVRSALALVARRAVGYGIVYASDARAEPRVKVVGTFPAESHPTILYPAAATVGSDSPQARAFLDYLRSPIALKILTDRGFVAILE
ncbi:MAG: molybdate ABC transporter substrate-binding protein [Pseudomonadota bacterium]